MARQMNENSLANLKKPKTKKEGYGYQYSLPQEKIDELFSHLAGDMSLTAAAREVGICPETARRYFREGDAKRGIQPLVHRLTIFKQRITENMNVLLEEHKMERLGFVRDIINKAKKVMHEPMRFYNVDGVEIDVYDVKGERIRSIDLGHISIRDIERLMKLETFLCGGVKTSEKENAFMSAEQISGSNEAGDENG